MARKPFSEEEKQFIIDSFGKRSWSEVAEILGRPQDSVRRWVVKLGLTKDRYHGFVHHPVYHSYVSMKNRCTNIKSPYYLEGIKIYDEWFKNPGAFCEWALANGWEEGLVLSRRDENKDFSPENCFFTTKKEVFIKATQSSEAKKKRKQTSLEKYGVEHPSQTKEFHDRRKATLIEKTGSVCTTFKHGESKASKLYKVWRRIVRKCTKTTYHRYEGCELYEPWKDYLVFKKFALENGWNEKLRPTRIDETRGYTPDNLIFITCRERTIKYQDKSKQTNLAKFGYEYASQNPEVQRRTQESNIKKYGKPHPNKLWRKEKALTDWLVESGIKGGSNVSILNGKEIDFYSDQHKIGIEFCGLFWHTEDSLAKRPRNYHYYKYSKCREQGIQLITIFSDEWDFRQDQVKSALLSKFGIFSSRLYARNCNIIQLTPQNHKTFVNANHIQGASRSPIVSFGLLHGLELVGALSLNRHPRNQSIVLDRMCFSLSTQVIGGASRLFNHCKKWCLNNNTTRLLTWSDNRWSNGNVYENLGFTLEKELGPDYSYVEMKKPTIRRSKQSMKKASIGCPPEMTEKEYANSLGFSRIWDCGKKRWIIDL